MILLGVRGQTKLTFRLDFPGDLCRAALAIFAMFQILVGILLRFQRTRSAVKKHST